MDSNIHDHQESKLKPMSNPMHRLPQAQTYAHIRQYPNHLNLPLKFDVHWCDNVSTFSWFDLHILDPWHRSHCLLSFRRHAQAWRCHRLATIHRHSLQNWDNFQSLVSKFHRKTSAPTQSSNDTSQARANSTTIETLIKQQRLTNDPIMNQELLKTREGLAGNAKQVAQNQHHIRHSLRFW
jgi:hypothetical protein